MTDNQVILTGDRRRRNPNMPRAQVLQIWKSRRRDEDRTVRIVELVDNGPGGDRHAVVVRATEPAGTGRRHRIGLDAQGRLKGYDFLADTATRLRCLDSAAAQDCGEFLRDKGMAEVHVLGDVVAVDLTPPSVLLLAEDAFEQGWASDPECGRIIAHLG